LLEGDGEFTDFDAVKYSLVSSDGTVEKTNEDELARQRRTMEDVQAVHALPIVVIKNYAARGGVYKEALLGVLANWAAALAENQVGSTPHYQTCVVRLITLSGRPCYRRQRQPRERKAARTRRVINLHIVRHH